MSELYIYNHWANDKKIKLRGKSYRVGKMSYGDYFLEPGEPKGENEPFNEGTIWLEKVIINNQINYKA